MSSALKIVNLHPSSTPESTPSGYDFMPNPLCSFRMIVFSPSNSGKSNVIKNLITRQTFGYKKFYDKNIFLFSQTVDIDPIWRDLPLPSNHLHSNWTESLVENLISYAKLQKNGILIILDDMVTSSDAFNNKKSNILKKLFYQGRHYKISLILVSQRMREIPSSMRVNATHLICFNLRNTKEEQDFISENQQIERIEDKYKQAVKDPYCFLYINKLTSKCYKNFETELR